MEQTSTIPTDIEINHAVAIAMGCGVEQEIGRAHV